MLAPRSSASTQVASVPGSLRSAASGSASPWARAPSSPRKLLREVPIRIGRPSAQQLVQAPEQGEVVRERLAEADPGVEHDPLLGDAGRHGERQALVQERLDLVHHVPAVAGFALHRAGLAEHVHQAALDPAGGHQPGHLGIRPQGADVVDDRGPGLDRGGRDRRLGGVDRQPHPEVRPRQRLEHRHRPAQLLRGRHRLGSRARGLAPDVEDVGSLRGQQRGRARAPPRAPGSGPRRRTSRGSR